MARSAVAVALAYFVAARLSLLLLAADVAVFWPAAGISAGTLIALGEAFTQRLQHVA